MASSSEGTLHDEHGNTQAMQLFLIDAPIVQTLDGQLLCDPKDDDSCVDRGKEDYCVEVKNITQQRLAIDYLAANCLFQQALGSLHQRKERFGVTLLGSCDRLTTSCMLSLNN